MTVVSKVLVHEGDDSAVHALRQFCEANDLVGLRDHNGAIFDVLESNVDLGGVFLSEEPDRDGRSGIELGMQIHKLRPELPIFLRRRESASLEDLAEPERRAFAGVFRAQEPERLRELVDSYIFSVHYPNEMVRGISEMTLDVFQSVFKNVEAVCDRPYVVRDKFIYGKVFSLMPLESSWCRGYMMFQSDEESIKNLISRGKSKLASSNPDFRDVNNLLSELANMAWGSFKSRFFKSDTGGESMYRVQVPIVVNHGRNFISFGSDDPQLCFRYELRDPDGRIEPTTLYQKFVFSLVWSPEKFEEDQRKVDEMVSNGELELF